MAKDGRHFKCDEDEHGKDVKPQQPKQKYEGTPELARRDGRGQVVKDFLVQSTSIRSIHRTTLRVSVYGAGADSVLRA